MWAGAPLTAVADVVSINEANEFAKKQMKKGGGQGDNRGASAAPPAYVANPKIEDEVIDGYNVLAEQVSTDKSITADRVLSVFDKRLGEFLESKGEPYKQAFMQSPRIKKFIEESKKRK
jgi:hypothetical protein